LQIFPQRISVNDCVTAILNRQHHTCIGVSCGNDITSEVEGEKVCVGLQLQILLSQCGC